VYPLVGPLNPNPNPYPNGCAADPRIAKVDELRADLEAMEDTKVLGVSCWFRVRIRIRIGISVGLKDRLT